MWPAGWVEAQDLDESQAVRRGAVMRKRATLCYQQGPRRSLPCPHPKPPACTECVSHPRILSQSVTRLHMLCTRAYKDDKALWIPLCSAFDIIFGRFASQLLFWLLFLFMWPSYQGHCIFPLRFYLRPTYGVFLFAIDQVSRPAIGMGARSKPPNWD